MIRSFFVGALVGFAFGTTKQGAEMRETVDKFLSTFLSDDTEKEEGRELKSNGSRDDAKRRLRAETKSNGNGHNGSDGRKNGDGNSREETQPRKAAAAVAEHKPEPEEEPKRKRDNREHVSLEELADAMNAKPTAPPTDELEPS